MVPLEFSACSDPQSKTLAAGRKPQLVGRKWLRDHLETLLAATNAAIATFERQMNRIETPSERISEF